MSLMIFSWISSGMRSLIRDRRRLLSIGIGAEGTGWLFFSAISMSWMISRISLEVVRSCLQLDESSLLEKGS